MITMIVYHASITTNITQASFFELCTSETASYHLVSYLKKVLTCMLLLLLICFFLGTLFSLILLVSWSAPRRIEKRPFLKS